MNHIHKHIIHRPGMFAAHRRHSSFNLEQLSSLTRPDRPASGRALKALLRQAEARFVRVWLRSTSHEIP